MINNNNNQQKDDANPSFLSDSIKEVNSNIFFFSLAMMAIQTIKINLYLL
jgi:hypothetical protein